MCTVCEVLVLVVLWNYVTLNEIFRSIICINNKVRILLKIDSFLLFIFPYL